MRLRFRPDDNAIYEFFTQAARNLDRGATVLAELVQPDADPRSVSERLVEIEHDNDELTHRLYNKINTTFVAPFDREDMYRLGSRLDDVIDHIETVGTLAHLYELFRSAPLPQEMIDQIEVLTKLAPVTVEAFESLPHKHDLRPYWVEANRLENEGDRVYRMLLVRLFSGDYDALTVLKMKEIGDELEEAADAFEQVANTVEAIIVKES